MADGGDSPAAVALPSTAASRRKFTSRGKRGGQKHRKKTGEDSKKPKEAASEHARKIALYHALEKRIARADSEDERKKLKAEQDKLGGLKEYQQASLHGARNGESSKWLVNELEKRHGRRPTRLLDVGAIAGTSYKKYTSIKPTYIDLNPQAEHVIKADFLDFPIPDTLYDVVCLSLVLNFVGSIEDRVQILRRTHEFLKPDGYLYAVFPSACVTNSRYMDEERLKGIFQTLGWETVEQHNSALLTHWLFKKGTPDGHAWPRKEIRPGVNRNNFVMIVKASSQP